jgi:hypothetical protein
MKAEDRSSLNGAEQLLKSGLDWDIREEECAVLMIWKTLNFTSFGA